MRNLLIAAAALTALAIPTTPAEADRGSRHWRSGGGGMHWQGHRPWRHPGWHGQWRRHPGWIRHGWRGHPGWNRHAWRGHPGWRWRHHPRTVIVGGGFGWGSGFGWGHPGGWGQGCRSLWFDGWTWRCAW